MKRTTDSLPHPASSKNGAPTIDNLLNAMPPTGLDSYEDRLLAFSVLGFYFDGTDYSTRSAKAVSDLIKKMEACTPQPIEADQIEDEDSDRYGFTFGGKEYWLTSPSIRNMPKLGKGDLPKYYRELISKLADDPDQILQLPYYVFGTLGDTLGKCLGIV
jgi:hypothetical protein